jgi:HAD superfamily hydrolase (TIGR01509 family)
MIKAILFDRDGVIIDTEPIHIKSATYAFKRLGIKINKKEQKSLVARHPIDYVKDFKKKYDFSETEFRKFQKENYQKNLHKAHLIMSNIRLIKRLSKKGYKLALTTTSERSTSLKILKQAKLENILKIIIAFGDYEHRKPSPDPYLVTAKKLKVNPKDCLVIEDSDVGVQAAKAAGMKCIAIPTSTTKDKDLSKADLILKSADKITESLIQSL